MNVMRPRTFPLLLCLLLACSKAPPVNPVISLNQARKGGRIAEGLKFALATEGPASTRAAQKMYELGGNIVDAAVAASFSISVERPQSSGLGGGGFLLLYLAKTRQTVAVDFREKAPHRAFEGMFQSSDGKVVDGLSEDGALASGVPGLVAGLVEVHSNLGSLPLTTVMQPAIDLAENGFAVYPGLAKAIDEQSEVLKRFAGSKALLFHADGKPLAAGEILRQPDLARSLREIAQKGREGFYKGWVAQALIATQARYGGLIIQHDLDDYNVKYRTPLRGTYNGYQVLTMPPPSSGGVHVLEIMNILEQDHLKNFGPLSPHTIHLTASAMQAAFADRATHLGDPDFVGVPTGGLTSKKYAGEIRKMIAMDRARPSKEVRAGKPLPYESSETTHLSLMDSQGNALATTQTVNGYFGSGVLVESAGFFLNNEMDDFVAKPGAPNIYGLVGGKANSVEPEKRPLSSMSPTIVLKGGRAAYAVGAPGGPRIITCVTLTLLNLLEHQLPIELAVMAPRYHDQWLPDELKTEVNGFSEKTIAELRKDGHNVVPKEINCRVQAVGWERNRFVAVSDPRYDGLAVAQ